MHLHYLYYKTHDIMICLRFNRIVLINICKDY